MRFWRTIILFAVGILIIVLVYRYRRELGIVGPSNGGNEETTNSAQGDIRPARIDWQSVDRTPDGFKIEMPIDDKQVQVPAYNELGGAEQVDLLYAYPDAETSYSVAWADNPPVDRYNRGAADATLDMARDGALARTQTTLVSESQVTRLGFPALDFVGRNQQGGVFNARLILDGPRLYMLMAAFPAASARRDEDVTRFFDSFTLVPRTRND